jgi:hypothetical protein
MALILQCQKICLLTKTEKNPEQPKTGANPDQLAKTETGEQGSFQETDNEEEINEDTKMAKTDWNLAMKFVPYFTGVKREECQDVSKFVSFDNFRFGCEAAVDFIEEADQKKAANLIWATKISTEVTNRITNRKKFEHNKQGHIAKECRGGDYRPDKSQSRPHGGGKAFVARKDEGAGCGMLTNCTPLLLRECFV